MTSDLPPTGGAQPPSESPAGPEGPAQPGPTGSWGPAGSAPTAPPSAPYAGPTGPTGPTGHGTRHGSGHGTDDFFNRIRSLGVTRPDQGRWVAGVAAGLSRRWDIDPIFVRGVFVALGIFGGIGVALYGLAWLLLPQEDGRIHLQQAFRG